MIRRNRVVLLATLLLAAVPAARASDCTVTSNGLTPIDDLRYATYLGQFRGGLYPNGINVVPVPHRRAGINRGLNLLPLDTSGDPSPSGKVVLLSIGMSNTTQEYCSQNSAEPCDSWTFMGQAAADARVNNTTLAIVNGAAGGQTASTFDSPTDSNYNRIRDTRLAPKGLTEAQVQAAWVKVANAQPTVHLPAANSDAYLLKLLMGNIARTLKIRYPNIKLMFLSSRIYAGYADGVSTLNPEPYAYESGFACKWLIEAQTRQMAGGGIDAQAGDLNYNTVVPWIGWGPYLWADGLTPRSDGLTWPCADLQSDGTHPSMSGETKVGTMLLNFMLGSRFSAPWFRRPCSSGPDADADGVPDACDYCPNTIAAATVDDIGCPPFVPGDLDGDGDVEGTDFDAFAPCVTGAEVRPPAPGCEDADLDGDGDADSSDFGILQRCLNGPDVPAVTTCAD